MILLSHHCHCHLLDLEHLDTPESPANMVCVCAVHTACDDLRKSQASGLSAQVVAFTGTAICLQDCGSSEPQVRYNSRVLELEERQKRLLSKKLYKEAESVAGRLKDLQRLQCSVGHMRQCLSKENRARRLHEKHERQAAVLAQRQQSAMHKLQQSGKDEIALELRRHHTMASAVAKSHKAAQAELQVP
jgi:hypothetical protein